MRAWDPNSPVVQSFDGAGYKGPEERQGCRQRSLTDAAEGGVSGKPRRKTVCGVGSENTWSLTPHRVAERKTRVSFSSSAELSGIQREWVTLRDAVWRVAPRADSDKIGDLPQGRRLVEISSTRSFPGWCPIAPRGFVSSDDIAPMQADHRGQSGPGEGQAPPDGACVDHGTEMPLARLLQMGLFEEQKLQVQRELESLQEARNAMAFELQKLHEERAIENAKLQCCRQQRARLEEKLKRCSDVVAFTVSSMDRLHNLSEDELSDQADIVQTAQTDVLAAGMAAQQSLCAIAEEGEGTEGFEDCLEAKNADRDKENTPPPNTSCTPQRHKALAGTFTEEKQQTHLQLREPLQRLSTFKLIKQ